MDAPSFTIPYKVPRPQGQDEEAYRDYAERGFPEVLVGDVYSHYKIVRKLGYGAFSTVWLAVDLRFLQLYVFINCRSDLAVALKVLALGASRRELEIMQRMTEVAQSQPGLGENVVKLLDFFEQPGINGYHLCLVMELMWQDITGFMQSYGNCKAEVTVPLTQTIARQALQGLEFLKQCNVVHNGTDDINTSNITDLHLRNLLFKFGPSDMTLGELLRKDKNSGEPENFGIYTLDDGRQVKYFQSHPLHGFGVGDQIRLDDMIIKIADFGHGTLSACFFTVTDLS